MNRRRKILRAIGWIYLFVVPAAIILGAWGIVSGPKSSTFPEAHKAAALRVVHPDLSMTLAWLIILAPGLICLKLAKRGASTGPHRARAGGEDLAGKRPRLPAVLMQM